MRGEPGGMSRNPCDHRFWNYFWGLRVIFRPWNELEIPPNSAWITRWLEFGLRGKVNHNIKGIEHLRVHKLVRKRELAKFYSHITINVERRLFIDFPAPQHVTLGLRQPTELGQRKDPIRPDIHNRYFVFHRGVKLWLLALPRINSHQISHQEQNVRTRCSFKGSKIEIFTLFRLNCASSIGLPLERCEIFLPRT